MIEILKKEADIIRKFAEENFADVVYINMLEASGQEFFASIRLSSSTTVFSVYVK